MLKFDMLTFSIRMTAHVSIMSSSDGVCTLLGRFSDPRCHFPRRHLSQVVKAAAIDGNSPEDQCVSRSRFCRVSWFRMLMRYVAMSATQTRTWFQWASSVMPSVTP